jgi:hypothetical protein
MRGQAAHRLEQKRDQWHVAGALPVAQQSQANGFPVEVAFEEVCAAAPAPLDQPEPDFVLRRQGLKILQHLLGGKVLLAQSLGVADDRGVAHVILASITKYAGPSRRFGRSAKKYSSPKRAASSAYVGESATMRWPDFTIYRKAPHKQ